MRPCCPGSQAAKLKQTSKVQTGIIDRQNPSACLARTNPLHEASSLGASRPCDMPQNVHASLHPSCNNQVARRHRQRDPLARDGLAGLARWLVLVAMYLGESAMLSCGAPIDLVRILTAFDILAGMKVRNMIRCACTARTLHEGIDKARRLVILPRRPNGQMKNQLCMKAGLARLARQRFSTSHPSPRPQIEPLQG